MPDQAPDRSVTGLLMTISEKLGALTRDVERLQAHTEATKSIAHATRDDIAKVRERLDRETDRRDDITGRITLLETEVKQATTFRTKLSGGWMILMAAVGLATGVIGIVSYVLSKTGK